MASDFSVGILIGCLFSLPFFFELFVNNLYLKILAGIFQLIIIVMMGVINETSEENKRKMQNMSQEIKYGRRHNTS